MIRQFLEIMSYSDLPVIGNNLEINQLIKKVEAG